MKRTYLIATAAAGTFAAGSVLVVALAALVYQTISAWDLLFPDEVLYDDEEPTGPGSGEEEDPDEVPTGPGSGEEEDPDEEPTGPGSGEEEDPDEVPTGPGSGEEADPDEYARRASGSCNTIAQNSTCVEYLGAGWAPLGAQGCGYAGAWSDRPCPRSAFGGCHINKGGAHEMITWFYLEGGGGFTGADAPFAAPACDANPLGRWITLPR